MSGLEKSKAAGGFGRRVAISLTVGAIVFIALWVTVYSAVTSALISSGASVVLVAASSSSNLVEDLLDAIGTIFAGVLNAVAAVIGALFSIAGQ